MKGIKRTVLAAAASVALLCLPITPAAAHEHYGYGGPCIVGNVIGAVATLVTLPLVVASAAVSALQPQAQYAPAPGYYGAPAGYYAPTPAYYARSPGYYAPPQSYYRPAPAYATPMPHYYAPPRGYYAARPGYSGAYGAPGRSVSRGW
jgi:hypothetical protein